MAQGSTRDFVPLKMHKEKRAVEDKETYLDQVRLFKCTSLELTKIAL
jgi:hypothetical protein